MHRAAPKGSRNSPRKCSCIGLRYSLGLTRTFTLGRATFWSIRKGPTIISLDAKT